VAPKDLGEAGDFVATRGPNKGKVCKAHPNKHSVSKSTQADVLNNWTRSWTGRNDNGRVVDIYLKDGKVVITEGGNKRGVITSFKDVSNSQTSNWNMNYHGFDRNIQR
jgi:hypothetical protein